MAFTLKEYNYFVPYQMFKYFSSELSSKYSQSTFLFFMLQFSCSYLSVYNIPTWNGYSGRQQSASLTVPRSKCKHSMCCTCNLPRPLLESIPQPKFAPLRGLWVQQEGSTWYGHESWPREARSLVREHLVLSWNQHSSSNKHNLTPEPWSSGQ